MKFMNYDYSDTASLDNENEVFPTESPSSRLRLLLIFHADDKL